MSDETPKKRGAPKSTLTPVVRAYETAKRRHDRLQSKVDELLPQLETAWVQLQAARQALDEVLGDALTVEADKEI